MIFRKMKNYKGRKKSGKGLFQTANSKWYCKETGLDKVAVAVLRGLEEVVSIWVEL
jgi:hypothetical protein